MIVIFGGVTGTPDEMEGQRREMHDYFDAYPDDFLLISKFDQPV